MTLLEALVALVILGASVTGFLGVYHGGARSVQSAGEWNRATAAAESAIEETVRARNEGMSNLSAVNVVDAGMATQIDVQPWSGRVDDIVVRVTLPDGRAMTVHRLTRRQ